MQLKKNRKLVGNIILLVAAFTWGMSFAFIREGVLVTGPFTFGASRSTIAGIVLGIICAYRGRRREITAEYRENALKAGIICGLCITIGTNLQQFGLKLTSAGKTAFLTGLYMLFIPIICLFLYKKKIDLKTWVAIIIGMVGMYFLSMSSGLWINVGDLCSIGCAVAFAFQMVAVSEYSRRIDPLLIGAMQFAVNSLISWILAFIFESPSFGAIVSILPQLLYCAIISGCVGDGLQMIGQSMSEPEITGLLLSTESVFGALGGALILKETMSSREILGIAIIFTAIILVQLPSKNKNDSQ